MRGPLGFLAGEAASGLLAMLNSPDIVYSGVNMDATGRYIKSVL